ncbi:alpha/beta fold hydrolase [Paraburkholderia sediminicola]|uniref:alpha/beta fold hydrolase n=1 Tax=Paraburkholderia sediminicola TaxID=458836 RepID=UPI0038BA62D1
MPSLKRLIAATSMAALVAAATPARSEQNISARTDLHLRSADAGYTNYRFRSGESLEHVKIHYVTLGNPHHGSDGNIDNAVLMLHGTAADGHSLTSEEYREFLYSPGKPLDIRRYYVIVPDDIGHGKSSKPSDGLHMRFPHYGYADIVDLQHRLVFQTLRIKHLHALIGMSMGGMNAWQWAEAYGSQVDGVMPVAASPVAITGRNLLWRRWLISSITSAPDWNNGDYTRTPSGLVTGFQMMKIMLDGVPHLQHVVSSPANASDYLNNTRLQAEATDADDLLYAASAFADYNPEPSLASIQTNVYALEFSDDEINAGEFPYLPDLVRRIRSGRLLIQQGGPDSYGHLTIAHPRLWAKQVAQFMTFVERKQNQPLTHTQAK